MAVLRFLLGRRWRVQVHPLEDESLHRWNEPPIRSVKKPPLPIRRSQMLQKPFRELLVLSRLSLNPDDICATSCSDLYAAFRFRVELAEFLEAVRRG
jgi:hypothetical protein